MLIFGFWHSMILLAFESSEVVRLRLTCMAAGADCGGTEFRLMFSEKLSAGFEAGSSLCVGGTPQSVVERYRQHVAENVKRLSHFAN